MNLGSERLTQISNYLSKGNLPAAGLVVSQAKERADRIDHLAEEKSRAWMEREGLLATDSGYPSGAPQSSFDQIEQNYTNGLVDAETYLKAKKRAKK